MTGRVLLWLLVCEPAEQTAAQLAEALQASTGTISTGTRMLERMRLAERSHVRGERADRPRIRPGAWDDQPPVRRRPRAPQPKPIVPIYWMMTFDIRQL